jgi:hypothetical protein
MLASTKWSIWMTSSVAASEGKKTDEGTIMSLPGPESNMVAVADPPEAETLTPATTEGPLYILTKLSIEKPHKI